MCSVIKDTQQFKAALVVFTESSIAADLTSIGESHIRHA